MKYVFALFTIVLAAAVMAEKRPFERYQSIIDRRPFGQPPPGYNPEQFASEAARTPAKTEAELTKEQQQLQKAVALYAINIDPDGSTMVGFSDMSDPKSPSYYYMPVGETRNGWFVKEASTSATNAFMTVVKEGVEVTLKLGETSTAAADAKGGSGRVNRLGSMPARPGPGGGRSPLLRRNGGGEASPVVGRRARREQEEAAAQEAEEARRQEQSRKEQEAAEKAAEEKAVREQEREEQRQQLMKIQEELRRAREEKELQKQKEAAENEEDDN